jgi:hypothetical protein
MSDPFIEMAEFAGRACGIVARDVAEISKPLAEGFRRGWREAMADMGRQEPVADPAEPVAPESA